MILRTRVRGITIVLVVLAVLALMTTAALATNGEAENGDPWEGLVVTSGGVTIVWASAQMGLLQILKGIKLGDKPLLGSPGLIWLANVALGVLGMVLAATQAGVPRLGALLQAIIAVFGASSEFEFVKRTTLGNSPPPSE